ncbi:MarR family winged helix-turn-helix transcriptional regulator [Pseudodonghicola flavimaris]|uniref:MarR family winged helix-turn-helix transcriptional regulator n=1 Tax=Pseudodonghicola flavimaris TaxID=3050036 RepID=A0ABT7EY52_9RHOB|nr:MarR family winged helix-turn-helix transcriptional regulator [Pseudodonghicola flavimaris]MDK3017277.1 MarR family winged helix-turn-helix transcriptional regulator [Pseudodonghicola flavimaris]
MIGETAASEALQARRLGEIGLDNFPPYLMNRIMGRYNGRLRGQMASLGFTTAKMRSLSVLTLIDGILIRDLSSYAVVEQSTLSRTLDSLAADGLVTREPDKDDSRATRVYVTDEGRDAFERLWPSMSDSYQQMFDGIPDAERQAFVATLHKILTNVKF